MKIAICVSGHLRSYKNTIGNFKEAFEDYSPDVFLHTWDTFGDSWNGVDNKKQQKEQFCRIEDKINQQEVLDFYNPKLFVFENYNDIEEEIKKKVKLDIAVFPSGSNLGPHTPDSFTSLHRKIYLCNQLRKNYEKQNGIKYDIVVRTRPDVVLGKYSDINFDKIPTKLILPIERSHKEKGFGICDMFAYSNSEIMDTYSNLFLGDNLKKIYQKINSIHPHKVFQAHLDEEGIDYKEVCLDLDLIRREKKEYIK